MSRDPQRLLDYLDHILQAIERIQRYTRAMDEMAFMHSVVLNRQSQFHTKERVPAS